MTSCALFVDGKAIEPGFDCPPKMTILDAASVAGWELPHSCRRGTCETCRATVLEGQVSPAADPDGTTLLCQSHAVTSIAIAPRRAERRRHDETKRVKAKLYRVQKVAPDVARVDLRLPAGVRASFHAGQYLNVLLPDHAPRSFSIASVPAKSDAVQLQIRLLPGGVFGERLMNEMNTGDTVEIELPFGDFYLREDLPSQVVLVAGGTGFAPLQSILEEALPIRRDCTFHLYWGARVPEGLYGLDQIAKWQAKHPHFRFTGVVSDFEGETTWRRGYVHEAVAEDFACLGDVHVYACGAPAMITAARDVFTLQRMLPPANFFSDAFVTTGP